MKLPTTFALASLAAFALVPLASAQNATTDPVGFVTCTVAAGTGTAKKVTLFSAPLLDAPTLTGQMVGKITSLTASTISNSDAGWTAGELSTAATPCLIQITSGSAAGRIFLISTTTPNTATAVTISSTDTAQVDLTTLGIVTGASGDTYKILSCDTLSSIFGTPETTGVLGGSGSTTADTVVLVFNGSFSTYFYNTAVSPARWSKVGPGTPEATNTPVPPYYGIQYQRLTATPISFTFTGSVPTEQRQVAIKNSGATLLSQFYPTDCTLLSLGLQNLAGWTSDASSSIADTVLLTSNGTYATYWFTGTNWKKIGPGSPVSDAVVVTPGTTLSIFKRGSATGYATFLQSLPYSL
jgi:hypothetical protein